MIHIVFQAADTDILQKAIELDESLKGDVIRIKDDYAVGPLGDLATPEGWRTRRDWWKSVLEYSPGFPANAGASANTGTSANAVATPDGATPAGVGAETLPMAEDKMTLHQLKAFLDENEAEEAWIWMAQNQHDVCGYYWLVSQLAVYQGRVQVLYLNNLPFLNEKGNIFYPTSLSEIQPSEFRKAKKLARPITLSEFEIDPDEWTRLCRENDGVRLLEGGKKIVGKEFDFYDKDLLSNLTGNWQKMQRLLVNTVNRMKIKTGDTFLAWRLRELVAGGNVQLNGDLSRGWNACEVKLPGAGPAGAAGDTGAPTGGAAAGGTAKDAAAEPETPQNV